MKQELPHVHLVVLNVLVVLQVHRIANHVLVIG